MQETSVTDKGEQTGPQLKGMYSDTRAAQRISQNDQQRASNAAQQARLMQQQVLRWQQQPWQQMKGKCKAELEVHGTVIRSVGGSKAAVVKGVEEVENLLSITAQMLCKDKGTANIKRNAAAILVAGDMWL
ncbi:TPA: hypothetical protein ACH3X1_014638 [Trebouxia sp. C0004]